MRLRFLVAPLLCAALISPAAAQLAEVGVGAWSAHFASGDAAASALARDLGLDASSPSQLRSFEQVMTAVKLPPAVAALPTPALQAQAIRAAAGRLAIQALAVSAQPDVSDKTLRTLGEIFHDLGAVPGALPKDEREAVAAADARLAGLRAKTILKGADAWRPLQDPGGWAAVLHEASAPRPSGLAHYKNRPAPAKRLAVDGAALPAEDPISSVEYRQLSLSARRLIKNHPPESSIIIGIGRSPTPLVAFLQNFRSGYAFSVPLSSFKYPLQGDGSLSAEEKTALFAHFDRYFPAARTVGKREIVLVDYASTGRSLIAAYEHLNEYLKERNRPSKMGMIALTGARQAAIVAVAEAHGHARDFQAVNIGAEYERGLNRQKYDDYSEYDPYYINYHKFMPPVRGPPQTRPEFTRLKSLLKTKMEHDWGLKRGIAPEQFALAW